MARILVAEPAPEVRGLVAHVVSRLGHEPVVFGEGGEDDPGEIDAAVLEPVFSEGLAAVLAIRARDRELPLVCASIQPRTTLVAALEPVAFVLKPFRLAELEEAIRAAVAARTGAPEAAAGLSERQARAS
jgi:DNA-binding response OmpR family regulator